MQNCKKLPFTNVFSLMFSGQSFVFYCIFKKRRHSPVIKANNTIFSDFCPLCTVKFLPLLQDLRTRFYADVYYSSQKHLKRTLFKNCFWIEKKSKKRDRTNGILKTLSLRISAYAFCIIYPTTLHLILTNFTYLKV